MVKIEEGERCERGERGKVRRGERDKEEGGLGVGVGSVGSTLGERQNV